MRIGAARIGAALLGVVAWALVACGNAAPAYQPDAAPTGTLVVVIRTGPDRVPFHPKIDRIRRANEQLTTILGHSIQIELDGAIMPQDHDGAEDVIARLVEQVDKDLAELKKYEPESLAFAKANFERLVVRYSPTEAAARAALERFGRRNQHAQLDIASKTIDVVLAEASWLALDQGDIAAPLVRSSDKDQVGKYAHVLPDALPAGEHHAWFEFHAHSNPKDPAPDQVIGPIDTLTVRGMLMLAKEGDQDARKYLIDREIDNFSSAYHHETAKIEASAPGSPFRLAEKGFVEWLNETTPRMTVDERGKLGMDLWVIDFRKDQGDRDRFSSTAFPGFDRIAFALSTIDAWIAGGHPNARLYDDVVGPVKVETRDGELHFQPGRGDNMFYRWAVANPAREEALANAVLARKDEAFLTSAFYNAQSALHDEAEYLAFLRRFESSPLHWHIGESVHRPRVYRPSEELLQESKRQWREVPIARGVAFFYFARKADGSYHPQTDWDDMLQGKLADEGSLSASLDLGWPAFQLLPAMWRGIARTNGRVKVIEDHARVLLGQDIHAQPGQHDVAGTLADVARLLCDDRSMGELAELRGFAQRELANRPGAGLSDVVEATDPAKCHPRGRAPASTKQAPPAKKKWKEGDPLPAKPPPAGDRF